MTGKSDSVDKFHPSLPSSGFSTINNHLEKNVLELTKENNDFESTIESVKQQRLQIFEMHNKLIEKSRKERKIMLICAAVGISIVLVNMTYKLFFKKG